MGRSSIESNGGSAKRKSIDEEQIKANRIRSSGNSTFELLNERLRLDVEWKNKEFDLKEKELQARVKEKRMGRRREI